MQAETVVFQTATKPARNTLVATFRQLLHERNYYNHNILYWTINWGDISNFEKNICIPIHEFKKRSCERDNYSSYF